MNNDIRKMLSDAKNNINRKGEQRVVATQEELMNRVINSRVNLANKSLEKVQLLTDLAILRNLAITNTQEIYKEVYRIIIKQYQSYPDLGLEEDKNSNYGLELTFGNTSYTNYDSFNNYRYTNNINSLISLYNRRNKNKIVVYQSNYSSLSNNYFILKTLIDKLEKDGFNIRVNLPYKIFVYINANKFRELMNINTKTKGKSL